MSIAKIVGNPFFWWRNEKNNNLWNKQEQLVSLCFLFFFACFALKELYSVKRIVAFLEAKQFLDKRRSKDLLILLVSFLLPLFLLQTSQCFRSKKKAKTICLLEPFFQANEETKRKKNFLICCWNQLSVVSFWKKKWVLSCCCCWQPFSKKFKRK